MFESYIIQMHHVFIEALNLISWLRSITTWGFVPICNVCKVVKFERNNMTENMPDKEPRKNTPTPKMCEAVSNPILKVFLEGLYDEDCNLSKLLARILLRSKSCLPTYVQLDKKDTHPYRIRIVKVGVFWIRKSYLKSSVTLLTSKH